MKQRELTPKELAELDALIDGDAQKPSKYSWDENFQRRLLGMLLTDSYFLIQAQSLVRPEFFSNECHVLACKLLFTHFQKYKAMPEKFVLLEELRDKLREKDDAVRLHYLAELDSVYEFYVPGLATRDVLMDKVTTFAKAQALKVAFHTCMEEVRKAPEEEATWAKVSETLREALNVNRQFEIGFEYFPKIEEMFAMMRRQEENTERFTSGFPFIDSRLAGGGPRRGEIYSWIGLPGTGKSLALVKAAVENVRQGKRCLYISLEMDQLLVSQRFTSQFMHKPVNFLFDHEKEICELAKLHVKDLHDPNLLVVKQFPSGSLDVNGIRAYHNQLQLYGFRPDLVVVDYVGEMRDTPGIPTWESRYRILRDLRGFAIEENFCCFTCVQPNKTAAELTITEYIDESNIGSSFDQFKPLDGFWSVNQLTAEKDAGVGRGFIIKHRNGQSRVPFYIEFDYNILTMREMAERTYRIRMNEQTSRTAEGVAVDQLNVGEGGGKKKERKRRFNPVEPEPGE